MSEQDNQGSGWTDYIYANGQKIAKVGADARIHTHGVFTASNNELRWNLPNPVNADGTPYTVRAGDMLCWRQYNGPGSWGGPTAWFSNGVATAWSWTDTSGTGDRYGLPLEGDVFGVGARGNECSTASLGGVDPGLNRGLVGGYAHAFAICF